MPAERDHSHRLLDAVVAIGADLELPDMLRRIVLAAVDLVDARYGALGVLGPNGHRFAELVHTGMDAETVRRIGALPTGCGVLGILLDEVKPLRLADLGSHPNAYGFPPGHPPMHSFLGLPILVRGVVFGNLYLTEKATAAEFTPEDERLALALATAAGVAIENARLYEQTRRREVWLQAVSAVTRMLLSGVDEIEAFTAIARHTRELAGAVTASVLLPVGDKIRVVAADGPQVNDVLGLEVELDQSLSGKVYRDGVTVSMTEAEAFEAQRSHPGQPPPGPVVLVPFGLAGSTRGVLGAVGEPGAEPFGRQQIETVQIFAEQAALAYELAEHRRDGEALTLFAERDRIARNLHDLVIQRLFATGLALEGAAHVVRVDPADATARIGRAVDDLDATIRQIRTTVFALQRPHRPELSVRAQVIELTDAAAASLGFAPSVRFDGLVDTMVGEPVREQLLAVLSEALSNVVRHARATAVTVAISVHDQLLLEVTDNGIGPAVSGRRSGLANMAARAAGLGGTFSIDNADPGTVLRWQVPLRP